MATYPDTMVPTEPLANKKNVEISTDSQISALDILAILAGEKRFIGRFVLGGIVVAILLAFLLPIRYEAKVLILPPQQNSSLGTALAGQLGGSLGSLAPLASLAGGSSLLKNPADMYVALLTSRTVEDALIYRFELMKEYHEKRLSDTRKKLEDRTTVTAGAKDGLIRLAVEDRDPKRSADLANGYVEEFRKLSASLAITEAARRRLFFDEQLQQAKEDLASSEEAMRKTEQSTGVLQIDSQARSLIESAAILRGQVVAKQVQIQSMRAFASEDNPALVLAKQELAALQAQLERMAGSQQDPGSDIILSKGRVTGAGLEYLRRLRDLKYHETVYELLAKQFEIAKLDEAREGSIVQVVDSAITPDRRSSPHRLWIIIGGTILAFVISGFWVVMRESWIRSSNAPERRQRLELLKERWKGTPGSV